MRAWARMFTDFLESRGEQQPYTEKDYFDYVDGKPRYDGVRSFLASRGIELPDGRPDDPPDSETVSGLGNRKNLEFSRVLETDGVQAYPGSVRLLDQLGAAQVPVAVVSSSRNAKPVLQAAGLLERFGCIVDGNVAAERRLAGKPSPDTFAAAAAELGVAVDRAVVVEDALSGVAAGRSGRFGLVIGVDRGAGVDRLKESGADIVVADLGELVHDES